MTVSREYRYEGNILYLKCTKCGKRDTLDGFQKNKNKKFGVQPFCKGCSKIKRAKFYREHRDSALEYNREYSKEHRKERSLYARDYCRQHRERVNTRMRLYRKNNKDKIGAWKKLYLEKRSDEIGFSWRTFHNKATLYVKKHGLRPSVCEICGCNKNIVMHHPSYDTFGDWSKVVFCCSGCHSKIHIGEIECPTPIDLLNLTK